MLKEQVIPANDGILDEAVAGFGDLLLLLVSVAELTRVADGDRASETVTEFDPVEQILDRHAQLDIINVPQDEHGLERPMHRDRPASSPSHVHAACVRRSTSPGVPEVWHSQMSVPM